MTEDQIGIALALGAVSIGLATSTRYAIESFKRMAEHAMVGVNEDMTILQEEYLYLLALRFRRQLPGAVTARAKRLLILIDPLVREERATRLREANDRQAVREAKKRARDRSNHQAALNLMPKGIVT